MWWQLTLAGLVIANLGCPAATSPRRHARSQGSSTQWRGPGCPPPALLTNGTSWSAAARQQHLQDYDGQALEVRFRGEIGPLKERRLCKIKCVDGAWVGPLCQSKKDGNRFQPLFRSCRLEYLPTHLVFTYKNLTIQDERMEFPHAAVVWARCREVGLFKLLGESALHCQNGKWSVRLPACIPTTMLTNFTEDSPPSVLVRVPAGSAAIEPGGELAVFPGSILHLECLYSRRLGNPEWTWTSTFRQYLTGWAIAAEERDWKYRLSIYYTKVQDSGVYTCATPRGLTNSITVNVAAVHCKPFDIIDLHVTSRIEGTRLGHTAVFQCPVGFRLNGTANLTCQASGLWSASPPSCEPIVCPSLEPEDPHLIVTEQNASYGGRAFFRCAWGHRLIGQPGLECERDGVWSGPLPHCQTVVCPPPLPPINGRVVPIGPEADEEDFLVSNWGDSGGKPEVGEEITAKRFRVGAQVQFACNERHQLVGETSAVCTDTGFWSHPPPFCKARCSYPGDPAHGRIEPVKFSYEPGDQLKVSCLAGFVARLEDRPHCRGDGTWSHPVPECRSYQDV